MQFIAEILDIIHITVNSLYPFGICNGDIYFVSQKIKHRYPIFIGRYHIDPMERIVQQLLLMIKDGVVEGRKAFYGKIVELQKWFNDGGNEK